MTMTHERIIRGMALLALAGLLWLGYEWWRGADTEEEAVMLVDGPRFHTPERMVFRDGKWVPLDGREITALLRDAFTRSPGLVRVRGQVRDGERGHAIPGAEVVFASEAGETSATADADGHYEIAIAPGFYRAFARADGYVAVGLMQFERLPENLPDPSTVGMPRGELAPILAVFRDQVGVDMRLMRGARVVGTVYDTSGRPVSGAIVSGRLAGFQGLQTRLILGTDMDESDLHGAFELDVPAGAIELTAAHLDFAGPAADEQNVTYLEPGSVTRMDLTLAAGCIIEGRVLDARGDEVGDGSLEQWLGSAPPNDYVPVGRIVAGRFRLARTTEETVRLRAWPWKSPPSDPLELSCRDGARYTDITFQVPDAEPDLEGTVLSLDGVPIPAAYIDIKPFDHGGMAQQERANEHGEWAFYALPPGRYHVMAHVPEHGVAVSEVTVPARALTLRLGGTGSVSGQVNGMSAGSFEFVIERCESHSLDGERTVVFDEITMPRSTRLVSVEKGAFHIHDLPACHLRATVRTPTRRQIVHLEIESGSIVPLSVDLSAPTRKTVRGVVVDASGEPASEVAVTRVAGHGTPVDHYAWARTDESGAYQLEVYAGDQLFFSGPAGWGQRTVSGGAGPEVIDMTLSR